MSKWSQRWSQKRGRKPYTDSGIRRMKCIRCGAPARYQWSICADNNVQRPICIPCDVNLNALVLLWAEHPEAARLIREYEARDHS